jgi:hypothetical protein
LAIKKIIGWSGKAGEKRVSRRILVGVIPAHATPTCPENNYYISADLAIFQERKRAITSGGGSQFQQNRNACITSERKSFTAEATEKIGENAMSRLRGAVDGMLRGMR